MAKKIKLLVDGPFTYGNGVYKKGDVFEVGDTAFDLYVMNGTGVDAAEAAKEEKKPLPHKPAGKRG